MAVCRAGAAHSKVPLYQYISEMAEKSSEKAIMPVPCMNVINGGSHGGNGLAMQEFMIVPSGANTFKEALRMGVETYHALKGLIKAKYGLGGCNVGDEGGFAPMVNSAGEALDLLVEAIAKAGYTDKIKIATDVAASEFYKADGKTYDLDFKLKGDEKKPENMKTPDELIQMYTEWTKKYPIVSIEDPFDQDDWDSYAKITKALGNGTQIVGDDLLVTNVKRMQHAAKMGACNALLLKLNQIGTVTEAIDAAKFAHKNGWNVMVSHRSGETEDVFIADLAVGLATKQIKTGAPCRSERTAKYNQLLRIEEHLGPKATFGAGALR